MARLINGLGLHCAVVRCIRLLELPADLHAKGPEA